MNAQTFLVRPFEFEWTRCGREGGREGGRGQKAEGAPRLREEEARGFHRASVSVSQSVRPRRRSIAFWAKEATRARRSE